jgi:ribosome recycling factor
MEEIKMYLDDAKDSMEKAIKHLVAEFAKIRAGKALPSMLEGIMVDYYGSMTPLSQVANINTTDPRTLAVKPWEKSMLGPIEKAIKDSDLGVGTQKDADLVRVTVPPLSEERRKNLVKQAKNEAENGKIAIRNIRKETNEDLRKLMKDGAPEDAIKAAETKVQTLTDTYVKKVDELLVIKEQDIMTV